MMTIMIADEKLKTQVLAKFPRTTIVASDLDPCLDENVQFSSMLYEAGAQVLTENEDFWGMVPSPKYH